MSDFLDLDAGQVMELIQDGRFPYAFDIGLGDRREPRILSLSVLEKQYGPDRAIGATKNLKLSEVIKLVLPDRDLRSTELRRFLSCTQQHVHALKQHWQVTQPPQAKDGANSFTVFSRASLAGWLRNRRMT